MIAPKVPRPSRAQERAAYEAVTARDGGKCVRCGWYGTVHRDHRQNRQPGNTVVSNLQLLCGPHLEGGRMVEGCHAWAHANPAAAILEGFAVPRWARPELWPGYRLGVGWVMYYDAPDSRGRWWSELTESTAALLMNGGHE